MGVIGTLLLELGSGAVCAGVLPEPKDTAGLGAKWLDGAGLESTIRGGADRKNFGRENGERFTGGQKGMMSGGEDLAIGSAARFVGGEGIGRREAFGEASIGVSTRGSANCRASTGARESFWR